MGRVAILVENIYEEMELWYPKLRLQEAGHEVVVAGLEENEVYKGKYGYPCKADMAIASLAAEDFAGVVIPGGYAPDKLRMQEKVCSFVAALDEAGKVVASICHGGWVLVSAKILKGRKATSYSAIKDDLENAGAIWSDQEVVVDRNLITSRKPQDLPAFLKEILKIL